MGQLLKTLFIVLFCLISQSTILNRSTDDHLPAENKGSVLLREGPIPVGGPPYGAAVETWWAQHPFNPDNQNAISIGGIQSPSNVVNVARQYGGNVQVAIDALPSSGGTLFFEAGTYNGNFTLVGKSNVHFVSNGDVVLNMNMARIAGCVEALDYGTFNAQVVYRSSDAVLACATTDRIKNIYFKNLILDGNNSAQTAVDLRAVNGVVFDDVTFQNFYDPGEGHPGVISGAAMLDNVWIRGSRFVGRARTALYLDGCHACGVIASTVDHGFSAGGFLFYANTDFTADLNNNGVLEANEQRVTQYVVLASNNFRSNGVYSGIPPFAATFGGSHILFKNNRSDGRFDRLVRYYGECQIEGSAQLNLYGSMRYDYRDYRTIGNQVTNSDTIVHMDGQPYNCFSRSGLSSSMTIGDYQIRDNVVQGPSILRLVWESGTLAGPPGVVVNNCVNGRLNGTTTSCSGVATATPTMVPYPGMQPTPSATPRVSSTPITPGPFKSFFPYVQAQGPRAPASTSGRVFPYGMFEDSNITYGDSARFEAMIEDLKAHHLDAVMFTNNSVARDAPLLDVSDAQSFSVFFAPFYEFDRQWWPSTVPANFETAVSVLAPLVDKLKPHPSLKGYIVADEPGLDRRDKVALMTQAFRQLDPTRPALPILIGIDRVGPIFQAAQPGVMLIDVYPFGADNPPCNTTMTGFGYRNLDFVSYVRTMTRGKPVDTPLWIILQTHQWGTGGLYSLRTPTEVEVRMQHWLAIGEGATGIFWFIYSSQQGWTGLAENTALYNEVARLGQRLGPLRETLLALHKGPDQFSVSGSGNPYVSTLTDGQRSFAVVVNRSCSDQTLAVTSSVLMGQLRDLESNSTFPLGTPIVFPPGDGKLLELVR